VYDIGDKLGKGSYAVVHRAIHKSTGEAFAVKIISKEKSKEKRLKSEVRSSSSMRGPFSPLSCIILDNAGLLAS
jgi:serine/threonine protein kinase